MSDRAKTNVPWDQQGEGDGKPLGTENRPGTKDKAGQVANMLQVPCPECGQLLALSREYLGGHCLCSDCDCLMVVSLKNTGPDKMAVVAEKVDKMTGEKVGDSSTSWSPEAQGAAMQEDWENTRPVKMWQGSAGTGRFGKNDGMELGATLPVPGIGNADDDMDFGVTMPVPKMDVGDEMDLDLTMPVPLKSQSAGKKQAVDEDWAMTDPVRPLPQHQGEPAQPDSGGLPRKKAETSRQAVPLVPPGTESERLSTKAPPPTSGVVPTLTTPPTKAPPPTTSSVPALNSGKIAARTAGEAPPQPPHGGTVPPWQPPGAKAPIGQAESQVPPAAKAAEEKAALASKAAAEKKKSDPFGNQPLGPVAKKKPRRRRRKSHKGLVFVALLFLLTLLALAVFAFAPGVIPGGLEAREFVDGKIDEAKESVETFLARRALDKDLPTDSPSGAMIGPEGGQDSATSQAPIQTRESALALQKLLRQEGEGVIRRFYGASTVEEKLAFVVDPDEARPDMEEYFAHREGAVSIRSLLFRGGTHDLETGYYYGVFDVSENENNVPQRWCVVDAGTGLFQLDWILYRQIVASELGGFLANPAPKEVTKRFHMLLKLDGSVSADDSPWFDEAVRVELQVPLISSAWYPVLMKKSLADSSGLSTKLMGGNSVIAVVELAWIPGDKDPNKNIPAITAVKRWGAWQRRVF